MKTKTVWLVAFRGPAGLANAILRLLNDPKLRAHLGGAAHQRTRDRYLPEHVAAQIALSYQEILKLEATACA